MTRRIAFSVILLLSVAAAAARADDLDWIRKVSVRTEHANDGQDQFGRYVQTQYGSGTIFAKDKTGFWVLTCRHVWVHDGKFAVGRVSVRLHDGTAVRGEVLHSNRVFDLSLVRVKYSGEVSVAEMAQRATYKDGLKVIKCGYPGSKRAVGVGAMKLLPETYGPKDEYRSFNVTGFEYPGSGNSGCGVYRVSDKKLIGVLYGGDHDGSRVVRLSEIRTFLTTAADKNDLFAAVYVSKKD
jgi:hypothetical protein